MQGSAGFGLSVDVYTCLDQQSAGTSEGRDSEKKRLQRRRRSGTQVR